VRFVGLIFGHVHCRGLRWLSFGFGSLWNLSGN
jgi:hypothetical protein